MEMRTRSMLMGPVRAATERRMCTHISGRALCGIRPVRRSSGILAPSGQISPPRGGQMDSGGRIVTDFPIPVGMIEPPASIVAGSKG
jgi:hypothetical protein